MRAESWIPLLEDRAAEPVIVAMASFLWERGFLAGRASLGDTAALVELDQIDPLAARLVGLLLAARNVEPIRTEDTNGHT